MSKGDPCSNGAIVSMLVAFCELQRILFVLGEYVYFSSLDQGGEVTVEGAFHNIYMTRYATMSMEMLFVVIPLRHNFILHHIEI
mgnify:FL=1